MSDLDAAIAAAVADALDRALPKIAEAVRRELAAARAADGDRLVSLGEVLGCTPAAARMREARDLGLRALSVTVGKQRRYRRADVLGHLRGGGGGDELARRRARGGA